MSELTEPRPTSLALTGLGERALRRGPRSLFGELLDWMLAPLLIIWPAAVLLTWVVAQGIAAQPYDRALGEAARALGERVSRQHAHLEPAQRLELPAEALAMMQNEDDDLVSFQVLGLRGELIAGDRRLPVPSRTGQVGQLQFREEQVAGESLRVAALWLRATPQDEALMLVQVAETLGKRKRLAGDIVRGISLPLFLLLPLSALLAWLALVQGFKPMEALQQRIRDRAPEDLSPIDEGGAPEEVAPLVRAVNELLAKREQAASSQRQFLADAAHQLKTP